MFELHFLDGFFVVAVSLRLQRFNISLIRLLISLERKFISLLPLCGFHRRLARIFLVQRLQPFGREVWFNVPHDGVIELLARRNCVCLRFCHFLHYTLNSAFNQGFSSATLAGFFSVFFFTRSEISLVNWPTQSPSPARLISSPSAMRRFDPLMRHCVSRARSCMISFAVTRAASERTISRCVFETSSILMRCTPARRAVSLRRKIENRFSTSFGSSPYSSLRSFSNSLRLSSF